MGRFSSPFNMTYFLCTLSFLFGFWLAAALSAGSRADNNRQP